MTNNERKYINLIIEAEGGYSNHPDDVGGETFAGISKNYWPEEYETVTNLPEEDRLEFLQNFYYHRFWKHYKGMPIALQYLLCDFAVNKGHDDAAEVAQRTSIALGFEVELDKFFGKKTQKALKRAWHKDKWTCYLLITAYRSASYGRTVEQSPSQEVFLEGWINRTVKCYNNIRVEK